MGTIGGGTADITIAGIRGGIGDGTMDATVAGSTDVHQAGIMATRIGGMGRIADGDHGGN